MLRQLFSGMSSHSPYISIIVPVYKAQHCLSTLVDSILSQAFTDWELLLIDDGSPDSSGAICDYFAAQDSRIHSFHKKISVSAQYVILVSFLRMFCGFSFVTKTINSLKRVYPYSSMLLFIILTLLPLPIFDTKTEVLYPIVKKQKTS